MTISISPEQHELLDSIGEAELKLSTLRQQLASLDEQIVALSGEHQQYQLVADICSSLEQLGEIGAAVLFWGEQSAAGEADARLAQARERIAGFQQRYAALEESHQALQQRVTEQLEQLEYLNEELVQLQESEERAKFDFSVEREERTLPYRPMVMPWTKQGEDENRFRKSLLLVLLFVFALGSLVTFWELPEIDKNAPVEIPEHLVQMVKKQTPKPPEKRPEEKPKEKSEEKVPDKEKPKPTTAETKAARKKAESSGVLAFKDSFNDLLADDVDAKLGSSARLSNKGAQSSNDSNRNLVMSQAQNSSGGINTASLSRNVGGAGGKMGTGVSFSRVESAIGTDYADDRPLSDGPGPSRTDEEIQIVFDRYKAALYRIYNRELRKNPTLKGKMVLRITIEPDGSVSLAKVETTDMNSPELSANIAERVTKFNFGAKDGVPKTTILYPIDFLPAS